MSFYELDPAYILSTMNINKQIPNLQDYFNKFNEEYRLLYLEKKYKILNNSTKYLKLDKHKKNFLGYTIYILKILHDKYNEILEKLYIDFEFTDIEIKNTVTFLKEINNHKFFDCKCWINTHGTKLMRGLFYLINNNKLPKEISDNIEIKTPDIYGEFTSLDIQKYIENYVSINNHYTIKYNNLILELDVNTNKCNSINKNINLIISRSLIFGVIHNRTHSINLNLWCTKMKKKLPKLGKLLGPNEINSGSSYLNNISLWREEEYQKLLIHETIHNYNIDFRYTPTKINIVFDKFNINPNTELRFFESYTELVSCISNCILCAIEKGGQFSNCIELINIELNFSIFQISKIFIFFGFNSLSDFYQKYDGKDRFNQTTSVFSYFFIKTVFLYHINETLDFLKVNCNFFDFPNNIDKIDSFFELFLQFSTNPELKKNINDTMNKIKKFKLDEDSLRMTIVET